MIRGRIRPFTSEASSKFGSIDQLFDKAAGAESMNNPGGKPHHEAGPSQQRDHKRRFNGNGNGNSNGNDSGNDGRNASGNAGTGHSWRSAGGHANSTIPPAP